MFKRAPTSLILVLAALVLTRLAMVFIVQSPWPTAIGWAGLLAGLSAGALHGKSAAARALAYLCLILGSDALLQLVTADIPLPHVIAAMFWASLAIGAGLYILRSATVKRFYEAVEKA